MSPNFKVAITFPSLTGVPVLSFKPTFILRVSPLTTSWFVIGDLIDIIRSASTTKTCALAVPVEPLPSETFTVTAELKDNKKINNTKDKPKYRWVLDP